MGEDDEKPKKKATAVDKNVMDEEDEAGRLEAGDAARAEGDDGDDEDDPNRVPESVDGWVKAQHRLFSGLSKLPKGWIRMRSKSKGLIYFYNVDTGASSGTEPPGTSSADEPKTIEDWAAQQKRLFPGFSKLPPGWIRMRSKSKGLVYYYNTETGESSPTEPEW